MPNKNQQPTKQTKRKRASRTPLFSNIPSFVYIVYFHETFKRNGKSLRFYGGAHTIDSSRLLLFYSLSVISNVIARCRCRDAHESKPNYEPRRRPYNSVINDSIKGVFQFDTILMLFVYMWREKSDLFFADFVNRRFFFHAYFPHRRGSQYSSLFNSLSLSPSISLDRPTKWKKKKPRSENKILLLVEKHR